MQISRRGVQLIASFEGFSSRPYWDAYGRVWTRGYGETEGITPHSPPISRKAGEARLQHLIETRYEWAIRDLGITLNQNQWDALCSFAWNLGAGIFTGHLRDALQHRQWGTAATLMLSYDHAGGQILVGLRHRRQLEAQLFTTPEPAYLPADEARWEHQYDQLRTRRTPWATLRRRVLQRYMRNRILEILRLVQHDPHGWDQRNRKNRYTKLIARA
jgi:lysozyme